MEGIIQSVWVCADVVEIRPAISAAAESANDFIFGIRGGIRAGDLYSRSVVSRVDQTRSWCCSKE